MLFSELKNKTQRDMHFSEVRKKSSELSKEFVSEFHIIFVVSFKIYNKGGSSFPAKGKRPKNRDNVRR